MGKSQMTSNQLDGLETECLAKQDTVPFCIHKGMVCNAWLMGVSIPYLRTKFLQEGSRTTCIGRLTCL
jgi:hypothetical protein